jgi:hypothetical protein
MQKAVTTRRSFLSRISSAVAALAMAPVLCRAAKEMPAVLDAPVNPIKEGMVWIRDPYPARFVFEDGEFHRLRPFVDKQTKHGVLTHINKEWVNAPYEEEVWYDPKTKEAACIVTEKKLG